MIMALSDDMRCDNCIAWEEDDGYATRGQCRMRAPVVVQTEGGTCTAWPVTRSTDRCMEFRKWAHEDFNDVRADEETNRGKSTTER